MKILCVRTSSMQCEPHIAGMYEAFDDVTVIQYGEEFNWADYDDIICIGAIDKPVIEGCIYYCCEASNPDWWPKLDNIKNHVKIIVNVDGNDAYKDAYTTLAIYGQANSFCGTGNHDPAAHFFDSRPIPVGFCGGYDPHGTTMRSRLLRHFDPQKVRIGPYPLFVNYPFIELPNTYHLYAGFLMNTKFVINSSGSSGDKSNHVKGRVLEAGLAGCCLLEDSKSPIDKWFSDDCYFKYNEPWDCEMIIRELLDNPEAKKRAKNLAKEVREKYNPKKLWKEILDQL